MKETKRLECVGNLQMEIQQVEEMSEQEKMEDGYIITFTQECSGAYTILCC